MPWPATKRRPAAITSAPPAPSPASVIDPVVAVRATFAAVVIPPRTRLVAAVRRMSPVAVVMRLSSACVIDPAVAVTIIVPVSPVVSVVLSVTESAAITRRWPLVEVMAAFTATEPAAERSKLPVPWVVTAVLTVRPAPVVIAIAPSPAVVVTPLSSASVIGVKVVSVATVVVVTSTASIVSVFVSARKIPPEVAVAAKVAILVSSASVD